MSRTKRYVFALFLDGTCQKSFENLWFRVRRPSNSQTKRCAIFKVSSRLRQTTLCLEKSSLKRNTNFALEAEARAPGRPRPAKTLTWHPCAHGRQTHFAKFYISKLPIHRHTAAVTSITSFSSGFCSHTLFQRV